MNSHKRKPAWVWEAILGGEIYGAPKETHRERKRTRSCSGYVALLCDIIDKEPSNYEEAAEKKEWKDAMIKEYQSIMKNDVWDVVPRPEGKSIVTSKWIYKIKHAADGSIEKYKAIFVASHRNKEKIMKKILHLYPDTLPSDQYLLWL